MGLRRLDGKFAGPGVPGQSRGLRAGGVGSVRPDPGGPARPGADAAAGPDRPLPGDQPGLRPGLVLVPAAAQYGARDHLIGTRPLRKFPPALPEEGPQS